MWTSGDIYPSGGRRQSILNKPGLKFRVKNENLYLNVFLLKHFFQCVCSKRREEALRTYIFKLKQQSESFIQICTRVKVLEVSATTA